MVDERRFRRSPETAVEDFKALVAANVAENVKLVSRLGDLVQQAVKTFVLLIIVIGYVLTWFFYFLLK